MSQYDSYNAKIRIFSEWSKLISQNLELVIIKRFFNFFWIGIWIAIDIILASVKLIFRIILYDGLGLRCRFVDKEGPYQECSYYQDLGKHSASAE